VFAIHGAIDGLRVPVSSSTYVMMFTDEAVLDEPKDCAVFGVSAFSGMAALAFGTLLAMQSFRTGKEISVGFGLVVRHANGVGKH
jgi:hypothetical protein